MVTTLSVEMAKGDVDTYVVNFPDIFLFPGPSFHISEFSLPQIWECYVSKELLYILQVLFYSVYRWALYRVC